MVGRTITKDKFPNFLTGKLTLSAANVFTTTQIFTPIPRLKTSGNKATVMELLWMDLLVSNTDMIATNDDIVFQMGFGSTPTAFLDFNDTRVFAQWFQELTLTTSGAVWNAFPVRFDFQSKDGYGYLLASDSFNVSADSTGQAAAVIFNWRLHYRFVDIPLSEFVGLVQSTQQS